jgi:hypothetical protein
VTAGHACSAGEGQEANALVGLERPVNDGKDISQPLWGRVADPVFRSRQIRASIACLYP